MRKTALSICSDVLDAAQRLVVRKEHGRCHCSTGDSPKRYSDSCCALCFQD